MERTFVRVPDGSDPALDVMTRDMLEAVIGLGQEADLLAVTHEASGRARLAFLRCARANEWCIEETVVDPIDPDTSWTFTDARSDQRSSLREAYNTLVQWLGSESLLFREIETATQPRLVVKVDSSSLWFLQFPLNTFLQLGIGSFVRYRDVEWITTSKSFFQHGLQYRQISDDLRDLKSFISGSVIVINTYREHEYDERCRLATDALVAVLRLLQDVHVGERVSLRWYLNPSAEVVRRLLLDPSTRYFFADFEASKGIWESGEGACAAWNASEAGEAMRAPVDLGFADGDLSHLRLMRVFHCNSVFDPFRANAPAGAHTLVGTLLKAGAWRVEGGMTKELYLDYLESIARLIVDDEAFAFVLRWQASQAGVDLRGMTDALSNALQINS